MRNNLFPLGLLLLAGLGAGCPAPKPSAPAAVPTPLPVPAPLPEPARPPEPAPAPEPPAPLPFIARWTFDRDEPGRIVDSGPNGLDGRVEGDTPDRMGYEKGRIGKALRLDPKHRLKIVIPNAPALQLKPPFTVAAWMRNRKEGPSSMEILCFGDDVEAYGWRLRYGWHSLYFTFGDGTALHRAVATAFAIPEEKWAHVAAVHDGKTVRLFVNAEPVTVLEASAAPAEYRRDAVIGNYTGRPDAYPFVGLLDEICLIGKALNAEELYRLASGKP